jgi:tRNA U34 5-methylaminomethyl-2-thiouridine-forming methyltransferase MnmC
MKREVISTADGSKTIYLPELNEYYHSSHGALQEAQHVFIRHGLGLLTSDYITVFELGFGTGLNALLSYFSTEKRNQYVHYIGLEPFPPSPDELRQMEYAKHASDPHASEIYATMCQAPFNSPVSLSEHFVLEKVQKKLQEYDRECNSVDIVFYDAFGPRAQSEMWEIEMLKKCVNFLSPGGIFVTYCAKGQLKRDLKSLGMIVESLPGPPGKREMTRATKPM